jgi:phosphatidylserine decarboxylase
MKLTGYGTSTWGPLTAVAVLLAAVFAYLGWWWSLVPVGLGWLALASFFRDPARTVPTDLPRDTYLSPGDGTVSAVLDVEHHDATGGPASVVRIFLSVLNVHVNRSPCDAEVVEVTHKPGKYLDARSEASAVENEWKLVTLRNGCGETLGVRQVTGKVARRIVCPVRPGDRFARGERFGMIKFGSTAELILPRPDDVDVKVAVGDKVRGGLTVLAVLPVLEGVPEPAQA